MRLLVTAGGTREPIDAARVIANTSTGALGAWIADEAVAAGHEVTHLHGVQAVRPRAEPRRSIVFDTSAQLADLLDTHAPDADAVVHAAAVADYLPVRAPGKIPSDRDELVLHLRRAPKLVDRLRGLAPRAILVGFKLTSGAGEAEQLAAATALRARARLDLVVVNDTSRLGDADHAAAIVGADGVLARCSGKRALAAELVRRVSLLHVREAAAT